MSQKPNTPYARFIPREELGDFAAWKPGSLSGEPEPQTPAAAAAADEALFAATAAARQAGYQDGYRDGLVALEGFKKSYAAQLTAQFGVLAQRFGEQLDALDAEIADAVAKTAVMLARQVLKGELAVDPAHVARVAAEAVDAVLLGARRIAVRVHPQDLALIAEGAADVLASRGARLVADAAISRGGCVVESDLGMFDARIETRWAQAAAALGSAEPWISGDA